MFPNVLFVESRHQSTHAEPIQSAGYVDHTRIARLGSFSGLGEEVMSQ